MGFGWMMGPRRQQLCAMMILMLLLLLMMMMKKMTAVSRMERTKKLLLTGWMEGDD